MRLNRFEGVGRFYFIGIGGVSMSALARFLAAVGSEVSGSDARRGERTAELSDEGIRTYVGEDAERKALLEAEGVVYTDAISDNHPELSSARALGKKIWSRADFLRLVCGRFSHVTAVAGSHGKTTCTAMCAHILAETGVPFAAHIGGEDKEFGNFRMTGFDYFVTEACEYKKNLLKIPADTAILLNIDRDHMECYKDSAELVSTFGEYCRTAKAAFVCADDEKCAETGDFPSFGIRNTLADYLACDLRQSGERYSFTVKEYGRELCRIRLNAAGRCNVYNALAAFAAMRGCGFGEKEISRGLENFSSVKRRFETLGCYAGASFICDYAHHPREIAATIATAEKIRVGALYVVFQPHTYSRTKLLMTDFVSALSGTENLMIYRTYSARERYDAEGSAAALASRLGGALYAESVRELKLWLKGTLRAGDVVLFLGAGDIYYAARYLLKELNK